MNDVEQMKATIAKFVTVIKVQNEKLEVLERRVGVLEADMEYVPKVTPEQQLLDRYTLSSQNNRSINETPERVAYAAHLYYICNVPAVRISECGLLSQSKMHGLSKWDDQHLLDYCSINKVREVYEHGLDIDTVKTLVDDYEQLQRYLTRKKK